MPKDDIHAILSTGISRQAPDVYTSGALSLHSGTSTSKSNANQKKMPPVDADDSKPDQRVKFYAAVVAVVSALVFVINFSVLVVLCRKANRFLAAADAEDDIALEAEGDDEEEEERETKEESEKENEDEDEEEGEAEDKDDDNENGDEEKAKREEKEGNGIEEEDGDDEESSSS